MNDQATVEPVRPGGARKPWARKRRRMLAALAVVLVLCLPAVLWRAGVAREARDMIARQAAQGRPVTLAQLNAAYPPLAEGENGANLYREALALYHDIPNGFRGQLPLAGSKAVTPGAELDDAARVAAASWLAENGPALKKIHEAAARPACQYLAPYSPAGYNDLSIMEELPLLSDLVCSAVVYHAAQGDAGAAAAALADALALARSLENEAVYASLVRQWAMEAQVLEALQVLLAHGALDAAALKPFADLCSPETRRTQIQRMCIVEQGLFVARLREGRRRGFARSLVIAAGAGDLNIRAYLNLMHDILEWTTAPRDGQPSIESRFAARMKAVERRPMLMMTLHIAPPPGHWDYFRQSLDQAAVAQAGMGLSRFRLAHGRYPDRLDELVPEFLAGVPVLPSTGEAVAYESTPGGVVVHNRLKGAGRLHFAPGPP